MAIQTFSYTGSEVTFTVPVGVTSIAIDMAGAEGGANGGLAGGLPGKGGKLVATLTVTPGETLRIGVGGKGGDGGDNPVTTGGAGGFYAAGAGGAGAGAGSGGGGGGGQSYIKRGGTTDAHRVLVAGGGGGTSNSSGDAGGVGGHTLHTEATTAVAATAGGNGSGSANGSGGGGGGWVGGAGGPPTGGGGGNNTGGGGSNMAHSTQTSAVTSTPGVQSGDGSVQFTWVTPSTIAQTFYMSTTEQDFTAASEVDIRKLVENPPGTNSTTICAHGTTTGLTTITLDPYTNRNTTGDIRANAGWAINRNGNDGMNSIAVAKRLIPAGTWTFAIHVTIPNANATGSISVTMSASVYRVSSSGARTLLFTSGNSNTLSTGGLGAGTNGILTATSSQSAYVLEADETIHVGFLSQSTQTAGVIGGTVQATLTYRVGNNTEFVQVPSPGVRTAYINESSLAGLGATSRVLDSGISRSTTGSGDSTFTRTTIASKAFSLIGTGTTTRSFDVGIPRLAIGIGTPTYTRATIASKSFSLIGVGGTGNILTGDETSFESSTGGWTSGANQTNTRSTAQAHSGSASLLVTRINSVGNVGANSPFKSGFVAGDIIECSAWMRPNSTTRNCTAVISYFTSADVLVGQTFMQTPVTQITGQWIYLTLTGTVPATANKVVFTPFAVSAAIGESHYIDDVSITKLHRTIAVSMARNAIGTGTTTSTKITIASKSFSLVGSGVPTFSRIVSAFKSFSLIGIGTSTLSRNISKPFSLIGRGTATGTKATMASKSFSLIGKGTVSRNSLIIIFLERTVQGKGTVTEVHPVQAFRTFNLVGTGKILTTGANASTITMPIDNVPEGGGGTTIIRRPTFIFGG